MLSLLFSLPFLASLQGNIILPKDTYEFQSRSFVIPLKKVDELAKKTKLLRLFVSEDRGKNWSLVREFRLDDARIPMLVGDDGLYWYAVQSVQMDGTLLPEKTSNLSAQLKVYINSERRKVLQDQDVFGTTPRERRPSEENRDAGRHAQGA